MFAGIKASLKDVFFRVCNGLDGEKDFRTACGSGDLP